MQAFLESKGIAQAIDLVGGNNKYQIRAVLIITLQHLFRSFLMMYFPYLNQPPTFLCRDPNNPDVLYDCNENNGGCSEKIIAPHSPNSLAIDLGLYCENNYIRTLAGTFFFLGGNIGAGYFSYLSDAKGRKTSLFCSYLLGGVALLLLGTAAVGPFTYILFLMLTWGSLNCFCSISLTYVTEISNENFAKKATAFLLIGITVGEMLIVGLAYIIPSWKVLFVFCIAVPALLTTITYVFLEETPVYYFTKKNYTKAAQILKKMASVNERTSNMILDQQDLLPSKPILTKEPANVAKVVKSWNYLEILLHPELRLRALVLSIIKLYLCMAYFGSIFALSSLGGNIYTNSIVAAFAEALGYLLSFKAYMFSTGKLLKRSLQTVVATGVSFLLIPSISCSSFFLCNPFFVQGFLALVLRTCICFMYGFIYSLGNELFPPEVRSQSIGISDIFAAFGGMVSPFIILIAETYQTSPLFLFGVLGFVALVASKYLPDKTIDLDLDESKNEDDVEMVYFKISERK